MVIEGFKGDTFKREGKDHGKIPDAVSSLK